MGLTCHSCGKTYEDHTFLCNDDICIDCHGGFEGYARCEMYHFFLVATQCFGIYFKKPINKGEDYDAEMDRITDLSMEVIRNLLESKQKYDNREYPKPPKKRRDT